MPARAPIRFFFESFIPLANRNALREFLVGQFKSEKKQLEGLQVIFCSDTYLLGINQQFLRHDYYTDIITFDLSEGAGINGEIYISTDRVRENATEMKLSVEKELHRVIFHGCLHLCGFGDKTVQEKKTMRAQEDKWLKKYFQLAVPRGTKSGGRH